MKIETIEDCKIAEDILKGKGAYGGEDMTAFGIARAHGLHDKEFYEALKRCPTTVDWLNAYCMHYVKVSPRACSTALLDTLEWLEWWPENWTRIRSTVFSCYNDDNPGVELLLKKLLERFSSQELRLDIFLSTFYGSEAKLIALRLYLEDADQEAMFKLYEVEYRRLESGAPYPLGYGGVRALSAFIERADESRLGALLEEEKKIHIGGELKAKLVRKICELL